MHPELAYEEQVCTAEIIARLQTAGCAIRRPYAGIDTCFRAELVRGPGPRIGLVLLCDALPGYGPNGAVTPIHACGHNVIAAAVTLAASVLAVAGPAAGTVVVMGLPADEIHSPGTRLRGGGKTVTAAAGAWDDLDAVLYAHPENIDTVWRRSRWMQRCRLVLTGPRALFTAGPDPVDAMMRVLTLAAEAGQRYGRSDVLVEEVCLTGDVEHASGIHGRALILLFADDAAGLTVRVQTLGDAVRGGATGMGSVAAWEAVGPVYEGILPNSVLAEVVTRAFRATGREFVGDPPVLPFATDFGNLSRRIPGALIGTGRRGGWRFHTLEGHEEFASAEAEEVMMAMASVLALAAAELMSDPGLAARVRAEFEEARR
ncbi:MAG: M20/M25/M40 family metallo-hydrolase [Armatimonadetes bacterium]|nr:M20/M25/M40 family metallo-hydrolase [Armatimonadota bacterium]